jgi:glutamate transport system ATP-binding protein
VVIVRAANRILFIDEGRILEDTTPDELFSNPREDRTKSFLSKLLHYDPDLNELNNQER